MIDNKLFCLYHINYISCMFIDMTSTIKSRDDYYSESGLLSNRYSRTRNLPFCFGA